MDDRTPLAHRLRPSSLADVVGQRHLLESGMPLRLAIERDQLRSIILAGPPGTGKTTLAHVIANVTDSQFVAVNAVNSGAKELREICEEAAHMRKNLAQRTVLFVDEIHRFNTAQQDVLLPHVEQGDVVLIGATTQNPYFDVNAALLSRSHVYMLEPLSTDDLVQMLKRAVEHERGLAGRVKVDEAVLQKIAAVSGGDARQALNNLELVALSAGGRMDIETADKLLRMRSRRYDAKGSDHYDVISAFIKSLRGSDIDAALVWMFLMLGSGEDPKFIFRRMLIFCSEDIGNADPRALMFVTSAWQAFELVGLPEGEYFLAHACIYLAQAPKSNAVTNAMSQVKQFTKSGGNFEVPKHLRNAPHKGMKEQGHGIGYQYPHLAPGAVVQENYFPVGHTPQSFYEPTDRGEEQEMRERVEWIRGIVRA